MIATLSLVEKYYKPEIDGLRALAVMSVILYHINPSWIPSGFVGVDIFLVISGYLITNIIIKSYEKNNFNIIDFYSRRIKRILPLTYFVLAIALICGWFLSYPAAYRVESYSIISSIYFVANIRFSLMGSYFTSAGNNPLLHLWSLSLEEQFYFIWPLFIAVVYKLKIKKNISVLIFFLITISLSLSMFFMSKLSLQQYTYFILPTRMSGLLLGAFLAVTVININKKSNIYSLVGSTLLIVSLLFINKELFPGLIVLLPLLGTTLIILTPDAWLTKLCYSNKLASFIGKISFSLYMWHWPILVFSNRYIERHSVNIDKSSALWLSLYFITLFVVSSLSYFYIENIFRKINLKNKNVFLLIFLLPLIILSSLSLYIIKMNGVPIRYGLTDKMTRIEILGCHDRLLKDYCYLNQSDNVARELLLIGDSHAASLNHFIKDISHHFNITSYDASAGGCDFYSDSFKTPQCEKVKSKINIILDTKKIKYIAIGKRFDLMDLAQVSSLVNYINNKADRGYKIILFKQIPKLNDHDYKGEKFMNKYLSGEIDTKIQIVDMDLSYMKYNKYIENSLTSNKNVLLLELSDVFCKDKMCKVLDDNGYPLYFDSDHLSAHGAEWLYDQIRNKSILNKIFIFLK